MQVKENLLDVVVDLQGQLTKHSELPASPVSLRMFNAFS